MSHYQVVLRRECSGVGPVSDRRYSVGERAVVAPLGPWISNASSPVLRRSCGNGVG